MCFSMVVVFFSFFFNGSAPTQIYTYLHTLSLHDALPIWMLEHLVERAASAYQVTIFNAEPRVNYDRIMLSPVLSGEKTFEQIVIHGDSWYIKNGVTLYKGVRIAAIDRAAKTITSAGGLVESYDKLVIATGSVPGIIPVPGHNLPGVLPRPDEHTSELQSLMPNS